MKISMHTMAVSSFVPMLESLTEWLGKGAAHAKANDLDLVNARLAPDMFTLAQQVQQACHYARDGVERLRGQASAIREDAETTLPGLQAQIARTLDHSSSLKPSPHFAKLHDSFRGDRRGVHTDRHVSVVTAPVTAARRRR